MQKTFYIFTRTHYWEALQRFVGYSVILCVCIGITYMGYARVSADTRFFERVFTENTTLSNSNHPYYFEGFNTIEAGVTVTVEKGVKVYINGSIIIRGKLVFEGEKDFPVYITSNTGTFFGGFAKPVSVYGGELLLKHTLISTSGGFVESYEKGVTILDSVTISQKNTYEYNDLFYISEDSNLTLKNSLLKDIPATNAIHVYNAGLDIQNTTFKRFGVNSSVMVYGETATVSISNSRFYATDPDGTENPNPTVSPPEIGLEVFANAYAEVSLSDFENFSFKAISVFADPKINITKTVITKNKIGIESYGADITISESEIFGNTLTGASIHEGTMNAVDNWWGSESGPKNTIRNPTGTGDMYVGAGTFSPWKDKKKKDTVCCSSILFVPGHQGSRIYKKGLISENQLWEPNINSDVSKLSLTADGASVDKTLYTRDIINKTNIVFGGNNDIEIYRGLTQSLNGLNFNYSIEDWQYAAYDWRMSPNTIVSEGSRYDSPLGQYKKMEDQIVKMADISKTKKVTILAHSYGGLITKRFLTYLTQRGKINLIDKVIFVAVPENGSPSSLFALLHGDNQDIGNGYIVDKGTMRNFAQNMPSAYALLPKIDQPIIYGIQATNTIATAVPSVSTIEKMYKFLFKEIDRPSSADIREINIPRIANKTIKQKIDIESTSDFIKPQSYDAYENIEFYSILGVGIQTPESISYIKKQCTSASNASMSVNPFLVSPNCGLDHIQNYSNIGDGVVLAEDVFTQIGTPRWGEKYMFNIAEYNRKNYKNYSHANIISSPPVISVLMQMVMGTIGEYVLPSYITAHGGRRMGGTKQVYGGLYTQDDIDNANSISQKLNQTKTYQISASDAILLSVKNNANDVVGIDFPLLKIGQKNPQTIFQNTQQNMPQNMPKIIPVQTTAPNSAVSYVGDSYHIHMDTMPSVLSAYPNPSIQSDSFNLEIKELQGGASSTQLAVFENIPLTEYSSVVLQVLEKATSTIFEMQVVDAYGSVYTSTSTYTVDTSVSQSVSGSQSGQSSIGNSASIVSQPIDILELLTTIRREIQSSGLRLNFKQRYILKLNAIEKNYKNNSETKKRLARKLAKDTSYSLVSIVKDLQRSKALYYKGGLRREEALFLQIQFLKLSRAFGD